VLERLKSDELRDYFEDDCVIRYREKLASITEASFDAVIVYPFVLDDRLELLVSTGPELAQVVVDVPRDTLRAEVTRFRELLEKRTTRQYLRPARKLNDWLIAPIEEILAEKNPRTLVFVPDGILRTIPMAPLHDGERFLIERYALGLTPGLELTDPQPFGQQDRQALVAGISEGIDGFAPLPNVEREVETVHAMLGGDELLNERFSRRALTSRIREKPFGLIHIASHAQFDSTAEGGFVLAHDGRLSFDALADAVAASKFRDEALELVILSACETAQGDERAALGLSGVAVKAGARSALGTLWQVSDEATAEFMTRFYASLKEPGTSRAEAVRAGQLRLLRDAAYDHPFYWSPFLLINSWL
jgi:CHAT domain-containing protein